MSLNVYPQLCKIADSAIKRQVIREGDYVDDRGILYCGKCGRPRQGFQMILNPTAENPARKSPLKVTYLCLCDEQEEKRKRQEAAREADMRAIQSMREASLMDARLRNARFSNYRETKNNSRALKLGKSYASRFDEMVKKNQGLLFYGDVGTGKSFLAACIANELLDRKIPVVMTSFVKLIAMMEADRGHSGAIINKLNRAELVVFDDLGAERGTDAAIEKVYSIVDSRYRSEKPMILTTNRTLDELRTEPDIRYSRVYDRVFEVCYPIEFKGASWRRKAAARAWNDMGKLLDAE